MKRMIAGCALAVGLVLAGAGVANAGEVNGNGDDTPAPEHASSECVFSGLDTWDGIEPNPPEIGGDDALAMRGNQAPGGKERYQGVQNYGMFASKGIDVGVNPGMACRGNLPEE